MGVVQDLRERRRACRRQRWTEVEPLDDYARYSGIGGAAALGLFVALVVVGLVVAR